MELTAKNVHDTFMKCLFEDEEDKSNYVEAFGIVIHVGFHPGRLQESKEDIISLLNHLPEQFYESKGDGWSFLNACMNDKGEQWVGDHKIMDELFCLGLAIDKVVSCLPRDLWPALPGGVPYYMVKE